MWKQNLKIPSSVQKRFVFTTIGTYLFLQNVGGISLLEGPSMLPTFHLAGDIVLIDKLFWKWREVDLGDILVFQSPRDPERYVIKRVLGKPGDVVYIDPTTSLEKIKV
jgi:mitochondrial inner membrane protease subunit 1